MSGGSGHSALANRASFGEVPQIECHFGPVEMPREKDFHCSYRRVSRVDMGVSHEAISDTLGYEHARRERLVRRLVVQ